MQCNAKLLPYFNVYIAHDCDTCDSKKKNIAVEGAHVHTRTRRSALSLVGNTREKRGISQDFERKNIFYLDILKN